MEQSDAKATKLKEELVNTKEALNKASLEHEVLSHEKAELGIYGDVRNIYHYLSLSNQVSVNISGVTIPLSNHVKILDPCITLPGHTKVISKPCFYHIRAL